MVVVVIVGAMGVGMVRSAMIVPLARMHVLMVVLVRMVIMRVAVRVLVIMGMGVRMRVGV